MLYVNTSPGTVANVSRRLVSAAAARGMRTVGLHTMKWNPDSPASARRSECRIYDFCNVVLFRKALECNHAAAAALPCRVAVYEEAGVVTLATLRPKALLAEAGTQRIGGPAEAMDRAIVGAIDEACGTDTDGPCQQAESLCEGMVSAQI